jgi:hypothetical protein
MLVTKSFPSGVPAAALLAAAVLLTPAMAAAQTASGDACAARVTTVGLLGRTTATSLADTGPLADSGDGRAAALQTASVPSVLSGEVLHATTVAWPDQVASKASLANLALQVGGIGITADFAMATAIAALGSSGEGASWIENLSINGMPVAVTGEPNQTVSIPGGQVVINEQVTSGAGTTVTALHATVAGVADVVVASATAGIQ